MADEAGGPEPELIRIESIDITPNGCPLDDALSVNVQFEAMDEFKMAYWEIKFIADQTNKRKIIMLGKTEEQDMAPGANALNFHVEAIDVSALSKHVLANVGLISLDLYAFDPPQNIVHVGMVTQVSEEDGRLIRHVFNPIE